MKLYPADTIDAADGLYSFDIQAEYSTTDIRTFLTGTARITHDFSGVA